LEEDDVEPILVSDLRLNLDLKQFFQYYKVLNARFLAQRIGMNPSLLSQYVRGVKRPSPKQTEKIIQGIQGIGRELSDLRFI
jgi:transcriptional regulator with XRE-family HTH domain